MRVRGRLPVAAGGHSKTFLRFEGMPLALHAGGYFFDIILITPKITTARSVSSASTSSTSTGPPPFGNDLPPSDRKRIAQFYRFVNKKCGSDVISSEPHFV
jgi:hypothetical protein